MAEKAEFIMIFDRLPELCRAADIAAECGFSVSVSRIVSIDNWSWEGHQELADISQAQAAIDRGRIALVYFTDSGGKEGGVFAEKSCGRYCLTLWLDAESCPGLSLWRTDADAPSLKAFIDVLRRITEEQGLKLLLAGVGVETMFDYSGDLRKTAAEAYGIDIWLTDRETARELKLPKERVIEF